MREQSGKRAVLGWGLLLLVALPCEASANAGTPLMWATMLHLVFGNALIGLGEGTLLALCFKLPKKRTIGVMVLANYFSAWAGMFGLAGVVSKLPLDLNNGWQWFWILAFVTYLCTLVLEWPFVALCFWKEPSWFRRSLWGNLLAQTASYAVIFGWYWLASGTSLYTKMHIVPVGEMRLSAERIYYIAENENAVYSCDLFGRNQQKVKVLDSTIEWDRLAAIPSAETAGTWDLVGLIRDVHAQYPQRIIILGGLKSDYAVESSTTYTTPPKYMSSWFNFGEAAQLKNGPPSDWEFISGFYPVEGLSATNRKTKKVVHFSHETLFGTWNVRNVTQLPSGQAVFQLGKNQVCVFDPETKQVALITHGRGPVVQFAQ